VRRRRLCRRRGEQAGQAQEQRSNSPGSQAGIGRQGIIAIRAIIPGSKEQRPQQQMEAAIRAAAKKTAGQGRVTDGEEPTCRMLQFQRGDFELAAAPPGTWAWSFCCLRAEPGVVGGQGTIRRPGGASSSSEQPGSGQYWPWWLLGLPQLSSTSNARTAECERRTVGTGGRSRPHVACLACCEVQQYGLGGRVGGWDGLPQRYRGIRSEQQSQQRP